MCILFWRAIRFNFYAMFAVTSTLFFAFGALPWIGASMARARRRALDEALLDRPGARPMLPPASAEISGQHPYDAHLADFLVPLGTLLGIAIGGQLLFDRDWVNEASCSRCSPP